MIRIEDIEKQFLETGCLDDVQMDWLIKRVKESDETLERALKDSFHPVSCPFKQGQGPGKCKCWIRAAKELLGELPIHFIEAREPQ